MAQRLTPRTLDVAEVGRSSLARRVVSLEKELYSTLSLLTPGVKMGNGDIYTAGGVAILLGMLHATKTGVSAGRVGLWLLCGFTLLYIS